MVKNTFFLMVLLTGILANPLSAQENKFRYTFPGNLTCEIIPEGKVWKGEVMKATMKVTGKMGTLQNLKVYFFGSPNIKVSPPEATCEKLAAGKTQTFQVQLASGATPSSVGTWIGVTVEYLPDYSALEKTLSEKEKYPIEGARNAILKINTANKKNKSRAKDGTRFFFEAPK